MAARVVRVLYATGQRFLLLRQAGRVEGRDGRDRIPGCRGLVGGRLDHYLGLAEAAPGHLEQAWARSALRQHEAWQATPFIAATLDAQAALPAPDADGVPSLPAPRRRDEAMVAPSASGTEGAAEPGLTRREEQVLDHLGDGASNKEIARALTLSVHTVERHVANVYRKIGARNRADATGYALRRTSSRP